MGKQYKELTQQNQDFIKKQKLFYMASSSDAEVNIAPKGYDSLRIINASQAVFLDFPGSGNRTARDISKDGEVTLLFNAYEGAAKIIRLFCKGSIIAKESELFNQYAQKFGVDSLSVRQFFLLDIYAVETSCGESIPIMKFQEERKSLKNWVKSMLKKGTLITYIEDHKIPVNLKKL